MQTDVDIQVLKTIVSKLDQTLDKISDSTNSISKLLAIHDAKIEYLEQNSRDNRDELRIIYTRMESDTNTIITRIDNVENQIEGRMKDISEQTTSQHHILSEQLVTLESRLDNLEQWKWYVIGALTFIGFLITNLDNISKFLKVI